ncbi:hypothetical protein PTKIN_Ptkin10aG0079600 [Pterospermum kingtungense]
MASSSRLPFLRRISTLLMPPSFTPVASSRASRALLFLRLASRPNFSPWSFTSSRSFCSGPLNLPHDSQGPAAVDYRSVLQEDEFHRLANSTIHDLQEKLEASNSFLLLFCFVFPSKFGFGCGRNMAILFKLMVSM